MALARPNLRAPAGPDSLAAALQEFQDGLVPDKRAQLLMRKGAPDATAVLAFTAEFDRANATRRRRGVASRFCNLLLSVQQYTAVMDTFAQVNADTTSLVWGSLKLTIHIASNVSFYFDKLSEWFMRLGTACPRYSEYQSLFSQSVGLQRALDAFYATVVRFCGRAVEIMERSGLRHLLATIWKPFEVEFATYESDLRRLNHEVMEEIRLASAQAASAYHSSGLRFRDTLTRWREKDDARNMLIDEYRNRSRKQDLLDKLSRHNYYASLNKNRKQRHGATCGWIDQAPAYRQWLEELESAVFWLSGGIGCGKSVMTAAVVDSLLCRQSSTSDSSISFFFCRDNDAESLQATTILGSLIRACLTVDRLTKELDDAMTQLYAERAMPDASHLTEVFLSVSNLARTHFIVIDGLDECPKPEWTAVLTVMHSVVARSRSNVKLFLSCRDDVGDDILRLFPDCHRQMMSSSHVNTDIAAFVEDVVQGKMEDGELSVGDKVLIADIREALLEGADGMFLWVVFQLHDICEQTCDEGIRQVLGSLPKGLGEAYDKALSRVVERGKSDFAERVYRWVAAAQRPLTLAELREVLYVEPGQPAFRRDRLVNDVAKLVSWCGNLVTVDEEDESVQFAHHTVKPFLCTQDGYSRAGALGMSLAEASHSVGEVCVTYLSFSDFERQLARPARRRVAQSHVAVSPIQLAEASLADTLKPGVTSTISAVRHLLRAPAQQQHHKRQEQEQRPQHAVAEKKLDILALLASAPGSSGGTRHCSEPERWSALHEQYAFLAYAQAFWLHHTANFTPESLTWKLWVKLVVRDEQAGYPSLVASRGADSDVAAAAAAAATADGNDDTTAVDHSKRDPLVECILRLNHRALLRHLLQTDAHPTAFDPRKVALLRGAAAIGRPELADMLLSAAGFTAAQKGGAFVRAVKAGHAAVAERLLDAGVDANGEYGGFGRCTALQWVAAAADEAGDAALAQLLLRKGALVDARHRGGDRLASSALQLAAARGRVDLVDVLLDAGADVDAPAALYGGRMALQAAAEGGHLAVVQRLLAADADVNALPAPYDGVTAMQAAVAGGNLAVIECLLVSGAGFAQSPAVQDGLRDALFAAVQAGDLAMVRLLMDAAADPEWRFEEADGARLAEAARKGDRAGVEAVLRQRGDEQASRKRG